MSEEPLAAIIEWLVTALTQPSKRKEAIEAFQRIMWKPPYASFDEKVHEILADLAYDLDYYEPDPELRRGDPTFFGDDRAEEMIRTALRQLRELGLHIPTQ